MSLLDGLVSQVLKGALGSQNDSHRGGGQQQSQQPPSQGGLGDGLGGILGQILGGAQQGGYSGRGQMPNQGGLGAILGQMLGGQSPRNTRPADLGSVLGSVLGGGAAGGLGGMLGGGMRNGQRGSGLNKSALLVALLPFVLNYIQQNGGLSGVLAKFNQSGLGQKAQAWVSAGHDSATMTGSEVQPLFDACEIDDLAQQTGATPDEVRDGLAELLPNVVSELTPSSDLAADEPIANAEISEILAQFGSKR